MAGWGTRQATAADVEAVAHNAVLPPRLLRPFEHGTDIVVHSTTPPRGVGKTLE